MPSSLEPASTALAVAEIDGEARVLDTDLGEVLQFDRPRKIRELIERHMASLLQLGVCPTVEQTSGPSGGRPTQAYYLNKRQSVFITAKSETARATEITIEVIQRFDEYERGERVASRKSLGARDVQATFRAYHGIAKLIGLDGNMAAIAANQATIKTTGVNPLAMLDATHLVAEVQDELLIATQIGERLGGLSAKAANQRLAAYGFQTNENTGWVPTEKGKPYGQWMDTSKRQNRGTPVLQWKWFARIVDMLRSEPGLALVSPDQDGAVS